MRVDYQRITEEAYGDRNDAARGRIDRLTFAGALVILAVPLLVLGSAFLIYPWAYWMNMAHAVALRLWGY